jgi:small-conductance mechanosensitive channel
LNFERIYYEAFNGLGSLGGVGIIVALCLLAILLIVLPKQQRPRIRSTLWPFIASLAFIILAGLVSETWTGRKRVQLAAMALMLASIGRSVFLITMDGILEHRLSKSVPKIFRDLSQIIIYLAIGFYTLSAAGVEPGSLLTTSALLTAVIGLSLQETLGNMFAGLALQAQQPFQLGDWIQIEDAKHLTGKVIEVNWRSTKILTDEQLTIVIPNGLLAKTSIRNYSKPSKAVRRSVYVLCPYDVPPGDVRTAILQALQTTPGVLARPKPEVITDEFADSGINYWIRYYTKSFGDRYQIDGTVRDRIWYALQRASITIPYPIRVTYAHNVDEKSRTSESDYTTTQKIEVLRNVDIFRELSDLDFEMLAAQTEYRFFGADEVIVSEDDRGDELFVVINGEVEVTVKRNSGKPHKVAALKKDDLFGEMSLMTGESRKATVTAREEAKLMVVCAKFFKSILDRRPELVERISEILAARQAVLDVESEISDAEVPDSIEIKQEALLVKIRNFFSLR